MINLLSTEGFQLCVRFDPLLYGRLSVYCAIYFKNQTNKTKLYTTYNSERELRVNTRTLHPYR